MNERLKFKKKKERERAVRKKILVRRAVSRKEAAEEKKKLKLEKAANKIVKAQSPELKEALEKIEASVESNFPTPPVDLLAREHRYQKYQEQKLRGESNLEFVE